MHNEDRGQYVEMEKPCVSCGKKWGMYQSEIDFYKKLMSEKQYQMPTRCRSCRDARRAAKKQRVSVPLLIEHVKRMTALAEDDEYSFRKDRLVKALKDISYNLGLFMDQNKEFFDDLRKKKEEPTNEQPVQATEEHGAGET